MVVRSRARRIWSGRANLEGCNRSHDAGREDPEEVFWLVKARMTFEYGFTCEVGSDATT